METSGSVVTSESKKPAYVLMYYDGSGNLIYWCKNVLHDAATSATDWEIRKFTYGANGVTTWEELVGSVDGRAGLPWV